MATCPRCKSQDSFEEKSWDVIPKTGKGAAMRVTAYKCNSCGGKFRKAVRLDTLRPASETTATSTIPTTSPLVALHTIPVGGGEDSTQPETSSTNSLNAPLAMQQVQHDSLLHRFKEKFHL